MTDAPAKSAPKKPLPAGKNVKKSAVAIRSKAASIDRKLFTEDIGDLDTIENEEVEARHHERQLAVVYTQSVIVIILVVLLVLLAPFLQPIYHYYARDPDGNLITLDPLTMPNMTNKAVISWAVTSVTEIMTIGFGDIMTQLNAQRSRFTDEGWKSFAIAFERQAVSQSFKQNQIVLTTVPSDTAVIVNQGPDLEGVYQWRVQVPIIMTFATNNNVTQHRRTVATLTIERVNEDKNPAGVAIKSWIVQ